MTTYRQYNTRSTPQNQPIPGSNQVPNSAGGFTWEIDKWAKLDRFLILGTEGGTYYIKEQELTRQNAESVMSCIKEDGPRVVNRIVEISQSGRANKNDPALLALAMCLAFGDTYTKRLASDNLSNVARIGTHLFHFAQFAEQFRGWGRGLKRAVANWYDNSQRDLAYQLVKYQSRDGWGHADLIKLSHPKAHPELYDWVLRDKPGHESGNIPDNRTIKGFMHLQQNAEGLKVGEVAATITEYHLPREAVPTKFLNEKLVWEALLSTDMGYEAMVRNLGNMSKVGLLTPMSAAVGRVVNRLQDREALRRARLHPLKILTAQRVYSQGHGDKGSGSWETIPQIIDALNDAFYESFNDVEPTGKRVMLGLDISGSMDGPLPGIAHVSCAEGAAIMAMVTARVEANYVFFGFDTKLIPINISPRQRLDDVLENMPRWGGGGTDCALPMLGALEKNLSIDSFQVYTDSETWYGKNGHPAQVLQAYRQKTGIPAKLSVVGMVANPFSIADPNDKGMMDFVGFDTDTPSAIANFIRE